MINDEAPPLITSLGVLDMTVNDSTPDSMMDLAYEPYTLDELKGMIQHGRQLRQSMFDGEVALFNMMSPRQHSILADEVSIASQSLYTPGMDILDQLIVEGMERERAECEFSFNNFVKNYVPNPNVECESDSKDDEPVVVYMKTKRKLRSLPRRLHKSYKSKPYSSGSMK